MLSKIVGLLLLSSCIFAGQLSTEVKTYRFDIQTKYGPIEFAFHAKERNADLVKNLSAVANSNIPKVVEYFGHIPENTVHVNIDDGQTSSNGTAQTFPRNQIRLYTMQPLGNSYLASSLDYYKKLFVHEFVHIIHLELTSGYLNSVETVFGSVSKLLPAIVPRWFSEGIAMWAEDKFTNEGRMKNPYLLKDVANYFKNKEDCQGIACLDSPGTYPYGSLSYWAGGYFIKYLEDFNAGTVACLIKENSSAIPFFLNNAFRTCLGETADFYFKGFLKHLKKKNYQDFLYQKGISFDGSRAHYFKEVDRKYYYFDGKENIDLKKSVVSFQNSNDKQVVITVDALGEKQNYQHFEVIDGKLNLLSEGPHYFFQTKKGTKIGFKFEKNSWRIYQNEKKVGKLENFATLVNPYLYDGEVYFSGYSFSEGYFVKKYSPVDKNLKLIKSFQKPFHYIGLCEGEGGYYKHDDGYFNVGVSKVRHYQSSDDISFIAGKSNEVVILKDSLEYQTGSCRKLFKSSRTKVPAYGKKSKKAKINEESYNGLKYLTPKYWFFLYSTTEDELSFWRFFTSMNDPLDKHTIMINGDYYDEIEMWGGNISYIYSFDFLDLGLSYLKEYEKNSQSSKVQNFDETYTLSLTKTKNWGLWETTLSAHYALDKSKDIFSTETTKRYGVSATIFKYPRYRYEFFNNLTLYGAMNDNDPEAVESYKSFRALGNANLDFYKNTILNLRSTYEKFDKKSFSGGIISGGGNIRSIHRGYGTDYSDVLGNEIKTYRMKLKAEVFRPYKGWGFVPFYIKTIDLIGGRDLVQADFVLFDGLYYYRRDLTSTYGGVSVDAQIFYHVPVSIEMISSQVEIEGKESRNEFDFIISGGYSF